MMKYYTFASSLGSSKKPSGIGPPAVATSSSCMMLVEGAGLWEASTGAVYLVSGLIAVPAASGLFEFFKMLLICLGGGAGLASKKSAGTPFLDGEGSSLNSPFRLAGRACIAGFRNCSSCVLTFFKAVT